MDWDPSLGKGVEPGDDSSTLGLRDKPMQTITLAVGFLI